MGEALMAGRRVVPGFAPAVFRSGSRLLRPEEQVYEAMVSGWADQQLARGLNEATIAARRSMLGRFQRFTNEYPWLWTAADVEEFSADLRSRDQAATVSTLRAYQGAIRQFCDYICDPRYEWTSTCERLFGTHPVQICFEWNTAVHIDDQEGRPQRRSLTKAELQRLFDHMDDEVVRLRQSGNKGWLSAIRDAAAFKLAYAYGLRRRELAMLDLEDFGPNPHAEEFGSHGVLYVRWGKASKGGPPRRRSVLTVFPWAVSVLREWTADYRPLFETAARGSALWPSERGARVSTASMGARFARYRQGIGLPEEIGLHCLRHSYVTHLIEDGFDPLFVQQQVGHSHASTTALYTSVSSDFRTRTLRKVLDASVGEALNRQGEP
jgi:site-specific recombinase XerD